MFIEGYAHTGDWQQALDLSQASFRVSRTYVGPLLCELWMRIGRETAGAAGQAEALAQVKSMFACNHE